jgi:hypothetical protein
MPQAMKAPLLLFETACRNLRRLIHSHTIIAPLVAFRHFSESREVEMAKASLTAE